MLFNSFEFLFIFLPIIFGLFYLSLRFQYYQSTLILLSLGSLFFYGYWSIQYLLLLLISILVNFFIGKLIRKHTTKKILLIGVGFNLVLLGYYKYFNFFLQIVDTITPLSIKTQAIILPLAISFYTFQQIIYLVDIYKGQIKENKFLEYLFFVSFFPQLIAGPIVQYREIIPQLNFHNKYKLFSENFVIGLTIFSIGLIKKVVIADNIALFSTPVFDAVSHGEMATFFEAWGAALSYNLQVYFDFSGYSDMAVGLGRMFGILLPQNFNSPFKSRSIIEFWQRWHMTLGRMIYSYVFLPLSMFVTRTSYFKKKTLLSNFFTIVLTYLIVGFWHGAGWTFICFGLTQGLFYFINFTWRYLSHLKNKKAIKLQKCPTFFYWPLTYLSLVVSFVIFRATDMACAISMYRSMLGLNGFLLPENFLYYLNYLFGFGNFAKNILHWDFNNTLMLLWIGRPLIPLLAILLIIALGMPNTQEIMSHYTPCLDNKPNLFKKSIISIKWQPNVIFACLLSMGLIVSYFYISSQKSEFLYFAF